MSQELISRSPDLTKLRNEGFEVEVRAGHLLVHSVPYVSTRRQVERGVLVSALTLAGDVTTRPGTHVAYFIGEHPCTIAGSEIVQIKHGTANKQLAPGVVVQHSFSNKPSNGYADYYEKMRTYIEIISSPARALDGTADARTFKVIAEADLTSVFKYVDTASSRAGITAISERLNQLRIAILGLGGTGSYVLDFVAKTCVREIHLYDDDLFLQHNAFRSPGAASLEDLARQESKVDYLARIYGKLRHGIVVHRERIQEDNVNTLSSFDFVFICIDDSAARKTIIEALASRNVAFVDVGLGVEVSDAQQLWGMCRVTASTKDKTDHLIRRVPMVSAPGDDIYVQNIQITELNALNAALAVVKWKKLFGVYLDDEHDFHSTYSTNLHVLTSEEKLNVG